MHTCAWAPVLLLPRAPRGAGTKALPTCPEDMGALFPVPAVLWEHPKPGVGVAQGEPGMASRSFREIAPGRPGGRAESLSSRDPPPPQAHAQVLMGAAHTHPGMWSQRHTRVLHTRLAHAPRHTPPPGHRAGLAQQHVFGLLGWLAAQTFTLC